jgi:acyl carrier protein
MKKEDNISLRLLRVISGVFGLKGSSLTENITQNSIEEWDSLGHLRLIIAVEKEFNVHFNTDTIPRLNSFGILRSEIEKCL